MRQKFQNVQLFKIQTILWGGNKKDETHSRHQWTQRRDQDLFTGTRKKTHGTREVLCVCVMTHNLKADAPLPLFLDLNKSFGLTRR